LAFDLVLVVKISDRVNNVSTMESFSPQKRQQYIDETREFIIPLCSYGKLYYPELSNALTAMKYHLTSMCDSIEFINK
jgi:(p)ppGpp synthase/HD superfamily hydrolase